MGTRPSVASYARLVEAATRAEVVLVGDDHALPRAQRNFALLAEKLAERGGLPALALEAIESRHQAHLDAFLDGRLDEKALLRKTSLRRTWPFDLRGLLRVLRLARRRGLPVRALDGARSRPAPSHGREEAIARRIAAVADGNERRPVLVLIGEDHLPSLSRRLSARRTLVLEQLREDLPSGNGSLRRARVVRLGPFRYALRDESADVARLLFRDGVEPEGDLAGRVADLARALAKWIGIEAPSFDEVEVVRAEEGGRLPVEVSLPHRRILLRNDHPHHLAEAAAHLLRVAAGPPRPSGSFERFADRVLASAFAFACSRFLNPHRAPLAPSRWVARPARRGLRSLLVEQRRWLRAEEGPAARRRWRRALVVCDRDARRATSIALGQVLGVRLHREVRSGRLRPSDLARFVDPAESARLARSLHPMFRAAVDIDSLLP